MRIRLLIKGDLTIVHHAAHDRDINEIFDVQVFNWKGDIYCKAECAVEYMEEVVHWFNELPGYDDMFGYDPGTLLSYTLIGEEETS